MKRTKSSSYRGGRGRSRITYRIHSDSEVLVQWYCGAYEWIKVETAVKTLNRLIRGWVFGQSVFSTIKSATRAIHKLKCDANLVLVHGPRMTKRQKVWSFVKSERSFESKKSTPFVPAQGSLVKLLHTAHLYREDLTTGLQVSEYAVSVGTLGFVLSLEDEGNVTWLHVNGHIGKVESRYLSKVEDICLCAITA